MMFVCISETRLSEQEESFISTVSSCSEKGRREDSQNMNSYALCLQTA